MADSNSTGSSRKPGSGAVDTRATDTFGLLGNETRMAILFALWEAYDPAGEDNAVPFSELRDRVGIRQGGQFNYHLDKLVDRLVRKTEAGYELRRTGLLLVQSVISGQVVEEPTVNPTEVDATCSHCGAPTEITYENVRVYQVCTECEGETGTGTGHPDGSLVGWTFEPTGLADRTAKEVFAASTVKTFGRIAMRFEGLCPECSGAVEWSLEVCDDHDAGPDEACPNCGRKRAVLARETCTVCKSAGAGSVGIKVLLHPAVVSFFYDHGVEVGFTGTTEFSDVVRTLELVEGFEEEVVSADPIRIRISITQDGDELGLVLDEGMNVIDVSRAR